MRRPTAGVVFVIALVVIVAATGILALRHQRPGGDAGTCLARVGGHRVALTTGQAANAAVIAAVGVERGLPARAVSIALATAYQESDLTNLRGGDRDSVGLFQQRPSQGWGSRSQLLDPRYAAGAFYDALVRVDGYQQLPITEAAQRVQRSAFPDAYAAHAADARALASALTGWTPRGLTCEVGRQPTAGPTELGAAGLTARAAAVRRDLLASFGRLPTGGFAPGGVSTGHVEGSAHYAGRAVDVFVRPVNTDNRRRGWAVATYLVARAERLGVDHVIFDRRIWSAARSDEGWREYAVPDRPGDRAVLEHRDHVHVDVP